MPRSRGGPVAIGFSGKGMHRLRAHRSCDPGTRRATEAIRGASRRGPDASLPFGCFVVRVHEHQPQGPCAAPEATQT
jgi:hypothetical protein